MMRTLDTWVEQLLAEPDMLRMGHGQREDCLGLGWIYYGLARALNPMQAVVIGSWRGFVPLVLGKALMDNGTGGRVTFIEPSFVDDFWVDSASVAGHFRRFGVDNIDHHYMTTEAFTSTRAFRDLSAIGILFIDGMHTYENARYDHEAFASKLAADAVVLFHDSIRVRTSRIYGNDKPYEHRVTDYIVELRGRGAFDILELPMADGVTLVRRRT